MSWTKDALLDIFSFLVIVGLVTTSNEVLLIIVWIYTGILLTGKILYFFINFLQTKANKTNVPDWFYHINYFLSILILGFSGYYYLTGAWIIIWFLSIIPLFQQAKVNKTKS